MNLNIKKVIKLASIIVILLEANSISSQTIKRQTISCVGSSGTTDGVAMQQTIGQPYFTKAHYDNSIGLRPGFQQFSKVRVETIDNDTKLNVNIFPNPASYLVSIESSEVIENGVIQLFDINGRLIFKEKIDLFKNYAINCENYQNGVYFITIHDEQNNKCTSKLIITK